MERIMCHSVDQLESSTKVITLSIRISNTNYSVVETRKFGRRIIEEKEEELTWICRIFGKNIWMKRAHSRFKTTFRF